MSTFSPITRRIRHVQRYVELLEVLGRYGFSDLAHELKLDLLIERGRAIISRKPRANYERLTRAERIRKALEAELIGSRKPVFNVVWSSLRS